jgi:hypothetical protein
MKVILVRKLADVMDGVDVRGYHAGDIVDMPATDARLLIAEEWAVPDRRSEHAPRPTERRRHQTASSDDDGEQPS